MCIFLEQKLNYHNDIDLTPGGAYLTFGTSRESAYSRQIMKGAYLGQDRALILSSFY